MPATGRSRYGDVNSQFEGGYKIYSVKIISAIKGNAGETKVTDIISDTRMQLRLPVPLPQMAEQYNLRSIIPF